MLSSSFVYPTIPTKDIDAARGFWVDTLGFSIREVASDGTIVLDAGNGSFICLYQSSFAGTNQATACAFEVSDIEREVSDLRGKGVDFQEYDFPGLKTDNGIATMDDSKAAWFTDIDGNIIGVFQPTRTLARA